MKNLLLICMILILCSNKTQDKSLGFYNFCEFHGKTISPTYEKRNCVQFMDIALKDYLNINDSKLSKFIYINYNISIIEKALKTNDTSIVGGVSYGLVKLGYAKYISINNIKKGDIVQYWSTDGFINGHCGIFKEYDKQGNMILVGSHQDSKGYGSMNTYSKNFKIYFYISRLQ